jgi:tripartite-type tricarboxylate transporter receptor subunit TctC
LSTCRSRLRPRLIPPSRSGSCSRSAHRGGAPDTIARTVAPKLTEAWGHQILVDPRTGAGGTIATEIVARAPPDGYTLLLASPSHAINSFLYSKLPYDPVADFAAVTLAADVPNIIVIHPTVPARSVKQLIALAKSKPGALCTGPPEADRRSIWRASSSRRWRA